VDRDAFRLENNDFDASRPCLEALIVGDGGNCGMAVIGDPGGCSELTSTGSRGREVC
jgi:hypothetical protein